MDEKRILILGAGPTGVGAGTALHEKGYRNWAIYERTSRIGGVAASETDAQGFTWDRAGHVLFSKDERFQSLLGRDFPNQLAALQRKSIIRMPDRWVPYPFQNHIRRLSWPHIWESLWGLFYSQIHGQASAVDFEGWIYQQFGPGIARLFMIPYNRKVWAHSLNEMGVYWMTDRVSQINFWKIFFQTILGRGESDWGPNAHFFYPRGRGFGHLFETWARPFASHLHFNSDVMSIDVVKRQLILSSGVIDNYDRVVSSLPLDQLVSRIPAAPEPVRQAARALVNHGVYAVGVGLKKKIEWDVCWAYFPDASVPFYRVTHLSKYSSDNVPYADIEHHSSLLCEIPYSPHWPNAKESVVERSIEGLIASGVLTDADRPSIVSTYVMDCPYAYPIPTLGRDKALSVIQPWLEEQHIFSRGRFGTWRYEIGNSDHAFMMGRDAIGRILHGAEELTTQRRLK